MSSGLPRALSVLACNVVDAVRALPHMDQPQPERPEAASESYRPSGAWTAFGLWLILLVFAIVSGGFPKLGSAVWNFLTLDLAGVREMGDSLVTLLSMLTAFIVVETPLIIAVGRWLVVRYGQPKSHKVAGALAGVKRHYAKVTVTVVLEELVTRGLFLGVPMLIWGNSLLVVAFYGLFLLGNSLWALVHLTNFGDKAERQWGRVLPQFLGGVPLTVVFVNFGLLGSIMVHLAFNYLLVSTMRKGIFNRGEVLVIVWHAIVASVTGFWLMMNQGKSVLDLRHWFDPAATGFAIPGWEIQHYLLAALFVGSVLTIVAELLLLDVHPEEIEAAGLDGVGRAVFIMALAFASFYGLAEVGVPFDVRVLIMALVFLLVRKSASGSGMARVFWVSVPMLMFQLCAVLALGWNSAAWLIALAVAGVELPDRILRLLDEKWEQQVVATKAAGAQDDGATAQFVGAGRL